MFKKKALTTAVQAAMVVSAATLMQGCNLAEESSTSRVSGTFEQVKAPTGTVIGVVQDTNGNPIKGAKVVLGGKTTSTNIGGQYQFNNVAVTNVAGISDDTANASNIQLTIIPPAKNDGLRYLGATVTVYAEAQIDGQENDESTASDQTGNQVTTFIDGFTASAGTAVLPRLNATVTGVLRDNNTGEIIANQEVALDFESTAAQQQQQGHDGISASYATYTYYTMTGTDGSFTITDVPNDSCLRFVVGNYTVNGADYNSCSSGDVLTNDEVQVVNVEDLWVTPHTGGDDINPFVAMVSGVIPDSKVLDKGVDGTAGITITFTEALAATSDGEYLLEVVDTTNQAFITLSSVSFAADGRSVTFTTASPLPEGVELDVNLARADFIDLAGNAIVDGDRANTIDPFGATVSSIPESEVSSGKVDWIRLELCTWIDANLDAQAVTNLVQLDEDTTGNNDGAVVQALNDAFRDTVDGDNNNDFNGLNNVDDDDSAGGPDTEERLTALSHAISGSTDVDSNVALVSFDASNASYYQISVSDAGLGLEFGDDATDGIDGDATDGFGDGVAVMSDNIQDLDGGTAFNDNTVEDQQFTVTDGGTAFFAIATANPGDVVTITPYDDLGYVGTSASLALVDNVAPTTIVQSSYGIGDDIASGITLNNYGDGAELAQSGAVAVNGTPNFNVTIGLLDNLDEDSDGLLEDNILEEELTDHNKINAASPANDKRYIQSDQVYDRTAWAVFAANLSRTVGVAFSEDVVLTGTPAYNGTVALTGYVEHNDITTVVSSNSTQDDGEAVNADLINVTVADVMALANTDHGSVLNFAGAITDSAGNTTTTASVVINDMLPPFITDARYNGYNLVITFNEAINPQEGDDIWFADGETAGIGDGNAQDLYFELDQSTVDAWAAGTGSNTANVLEIPMSDWANDNGSETGTDWDEFFDIGDFVEEIAVVSHATIQTNVADVRGNTQMGEAWNFWAGGPDNWNGPTGEGLEPVGFAIYNTIQDFVVTVDETDFDTAGSDGNGALGGDLFVLTYDSNHALDLEDTWGLTDLNDGGTLDAADVAALFSFTAGTCVIETAGGTDTGGVYTYDTATSTYELEITIETTADCITDGNDTVEPNSPFESMWDIADLSQQPDIDN